jgi:hypothetical protein
LSTLEQERISLRTEGTKKEGVREGNVSDFFEAAQGWLSVFFLFISYNKRAACPEQPNATSRMPDRGIAGQGYALSQSGVAPVDALTRFEPLRQQTGAIRPGAAVGFAVHATIFAQDRADAPADAAQHVGVAV